MTLESDLERAAYSRPGHSIVAFKEAGLPVFVLRLRALILERKPLSPIEEAVLKSIQAGLDEPSSIYEFLGLPGAVLTPVLAALNVAELINYARASSDVDAKVTLSKKGKVALADAATIKPQARSIEVCFDALTRKLLFISPSQLYRPRDMRERGLYEVPIAGSKRPEIEDIPLQDFDKVLQRQLTTSESTGTLLGIRRIERRELRYMGCSMFFFRAATSVDVSVSFWREDGPSIAHEMAFVEAGGPDQVGARGLGEGPGSAELEREFTTEAVPDKGDKDAGQADPGEGVSQANSPTAKNAPAPSPPIPTMQSILCFEHPPLLRQALASAQHRLIIVSPWVRDAVVDGPFVSCLERLLRDGVEVHIGYGIANADGGKGNAANSKPDIQPVAERELKKLSARFSKFYLVHVGNTHRKVLICDDRFAVVTSFNWLSYKGDSRGKARDEFGLVLRKRDHVESRAAEALQLLGKGYSGPVTARSMAS